MGSAGRLGDCAAADGDALGPLVAEGLGGAGASAERRDWPTSPEGWGLSPPTPTAAPSPSSVFGPVSGRPSAAVPVDVARPRSAGAPPHQASGVRRAAHLLSGPGA